MSERQQKQRNKALTDALQGGALEDVEWALEQGAELTAVDRLGRPVLAIAAVQGPEGSVDLLIERGANVNAWSKNGRQPIHAAVLKGNLAACRSLLSAGAFSGSEGSDGVTPLHSVAHAPSNRKEIVDLLVEAGADVHATDGKGNTPLHLAGRHSNGEVAQALLAHGADMEAKNIKGETPRQVFAKFIPMAGTLDARDVFQAYDRKQALSQIAQGNTTQNDLASPEEALSRRGRGRFM